MTTLVDLDNLCGTFLSILYNMQKPYYFRREQFVNNNELQMRRGRSIVLLFHIMLYVQLQIRRGILRARDISIPKITGG
jgi:hypothetical protein